MKVYEAESACLYAGRFSWRMPKQWEVISHVYRINEVEIREIGGINPDIGPSLWESRLEEIRTETLGADGWTSLILEDGEISTNEKYVLYHPPCSSQQFIDAEGLLLLPDVAVWFKAEQLTATTSPDKLKQKLQAVMGVYERPSAENTLFQGNWFYTAYGRLAIENTKEELLNLDMNEEGLSLDIFMGKSAQENKPKLLERLQKFMPQVGPKLCKVRSGMRKIVDMEGEEVIFYFPDPEQKVLETNFQWYYPGKPNSLQYPEIEVQWHGDIPDTEKIEPRTEIWDSFLGSLQSIYRKTAE